MNFEAFGSSPDFTTPINKFLFENSPKFEVSTGEQSLGNYDLFKKYSALLESTLEKFLSYGKLSPEVFLEAMQFAREENLPCSFLDYVLSASEYSEFCTLMSDYKKIAEGEVKADSSYV